MSKQANDNDGFLSATERRLFDALEGYAFHMQPTDFVPTRELYKAYVKSMQAMPGPADWLGMMEFETSLRHVFGLPGAWKVRRTIDGRQLSGYLFIRGPGSFTVPLEDNADAALAEVECLAC